MIEDGDVYELLKQRERQVEQVQWEDNKTTTNWVGIYDGISNESYHAAPGLSASGLKKFAKTPAHYRAYLESDDKETSSQRLGTLAHMAILEPESFKSVAIVDGNRNSNDVKAKIAAYTAEGKYVCKTEEYEDVKKMRDAVMSNNTVKQLLSGGKSEQSVFVADPSGILMKCRPDYMREDVLVDLKTFSDLDNFSLERQIYKMKYHWQSAFYLKVAGLALGKAPSHFAHLFIETKAPYACRVVRLNDAAIERANQEIAPLLAQYAECLTTNNWPGYADEITDLSLPSYGFNTWE